jgi:hypothetical protein
MLDGMVNLERVHWAKVEEGVNGTRDFMKAEPNHSAEPSIPGRAANCQNEP